MSLTIVRLLPVIIGASMLPLWIVMTLLFLRSERGTSKAAAFAAGAMTIRLLQGLLFGYFFVRAADGRGQGTAHLIASTILVVVGVALLITVVHTWLRKDDPDAPPPRWMERISGVSALTAFGMGALLMALALKQWVFTFSAIAIIEDGYLGYKRSVVAFFFFVVAAQSLLLAPIISTALAPKQAATMLGALEAWLLRNNRVVTIILSLLFGGWLLSKGATGLLERNAATATGPAELAAID